MNKKGYYVGLDLGTASVGWAATDLNYNLLKLRGKKTLGVRLFNEASTAADRRNYRSNRRRKERRRYRLKLLRCLFEKEIEKVDKDFFNRLGESKYWFNDKSVNTKNILFNDINYKDKDFYKEYPTIYHLRATLFDKKNPDIREIYLACHHIIKYRGSFLYEGKSISSSSTMKSIFSSLCNESMLSESFMEILTSEDNIRNIEEILLNKKISRLDKTKKLSLLVEKNKQLTEFFKIAIGLSGNLATLFQDNSLKESDKPKIHLDKIIYDDVRTDYESILGDEIVILDLAKQLYDAIILANMKKENLTISESKAEIYEEHKKDLKILKNAILEDSNLNEKERKSLYKKCFRKNLKDNYVAYARRNSLSKGGNGSIRNVASYDDFKSFLNKNILNELSNQDLVNEIKLKLDRNEFLQLLRSKNNAVVPYQLHKEELEKILKNAEEYYPFLVDKIDGLTISEKVIKLLEFRIPYYVGPLNNYHEDKGGNSWVVRNSTTPITPWNFDEVVDKEKSAEKFINRMTKKCTYLINEDVLPKNSLLYSEFSLLNELNNIKVDNKKLPLEIKNDIIETFYKKSTRKVTKSTLESYLKSIGILDKKQELTGLDKNIQTTLKSYVEIKNILQEDFEYTMVENIILWITLFGEAKDILENKIKIAYGNILSDKKIFQLLNLKYNDWGRLSRKFLTEILSDKVVNIIGESSSIIDAMRNTSCNLMELLSKDIGFLEAVERYNDSKNLKNDGKLTYELIEDQYLSPSVKRSIWQSLKILDELTREIGSNPKKIFIETTRKNILDKNVPASRKKKLEKSYKNINVSEYIDRSKFENLDNESLRQKKYYLYYQQLGRCMYTGNKIDIDRLNTDAYDIDHIYPRSKTKDDSILDNLVLVTRTSNAKKENKYPLESVLKIKDETKKHWKLLRDLELISKEKYNRLIRVEPLTNEELANFINRQLVETSQSVKTLANLLKVLYPETEICYVKAKNVSDFRYTFAYDTKLDEKTKKQKTVIKNPELIKIRDLNNLHHAHDAYLNIVVGNSFDVKFTKNITGIISNKNFKYNLDKMYNYNIIRGDLVAWDKDKTLDTVLESLNYKRVLVTRKAESQKGAFYDATIYNKKTAKNLVYMPLKTSDKKLQDVTKYGGFAKIKIAYYSIVSYSVLSKNKEEEKSIILPIPIHLKYKIKCDEDIINYAKKFVVSEDVEVQNIFIKYKKLTIGSLVKINDYYYYIGGKINNYIIVDGATQVLFDKEYIPMLKDVAVLNYKNIETKGKLDKINTSRILPENNIALYDYIVSKMNNGIFKNHRSNRYSEFSRQEVREKFLELSIEEQCSAILELLNVISNNKTTYNTKKYFDVTCSRSTISSTLNNIYEFEIIEQSITGLREKTVKII
ncbi:type II CRISPR RNA-guided endonuclease Cas9 [Gemella sp. GH3]|uniref:type II CRISPR RNA-guided endonuclease Cas9 n=1 Tax=unclassified Gemella TaxID=2624949 RepID=UPI0015D0704C|nr:MULTISPECIES: type II CRISPR RNA-guided endonuclease Cas9 [unclassified Gemella]MBF0714024.1 type II CRISPR RNA-guided endonuclease Cas9 [Gemella sp. GH3.1]NYS50976.1 type II CRISPR RNA-guided endonuclease Cas9 [Gemella sp. GH3]